MPVRNTPANDRFRRAIARRSDVRLHGRGAARCLALLALIALAAFAGGCGDSGDSGERKIVLTAADVRKAFQHQGLDLAAYEIGPGIPALVYPVGALEDDAEYLVVCEIYDFPVMARGVVMTIRKKRPGSISRALRAKNVVVLIDPVATPDEVQRTLRAVVELRHE
jgi:hypothetical protein